MRFSCRDPGQGQALTASLKEPWPGPHLLAVTFGLTGSVARFSFIGVREAAAACRRHPHIQRTRMHAARAQPGEMPLGDQQPGRPRLLLLRERVSQRIALLPGARAHRLSVGRSAVSRGCVNHRSRAAGQRHEIAPVAVVCPACSRSPDGLLALMESANRGLITRAGSMSQ